MSKKRETVGKISLDLSEKKTPSRDPIELEREMHKDYEKNVLECIERAEKDIPGDFFLVVITKRERLMANVLRNYFYYRKTCPTPDYDQAVYLYNRSEELLKFLWVIPCKDACNKLHNFAVEVPESERELLKFVLDFKDGTLFKLAKRFNGESKDSPLIEG